MVVVRGEFKKRREGGKGGPTLSGFARRREY